jgi:sugar (pentulose or hexulose) kinase
VAAGSRVWLGIDVGTQGLRAVAVDGDGRSVASASRPLVSDRTVLGHHEQDPHAWIAAAAAVCSTIVASLPSREVGGVAICATSGTILLGTRDGAPLTPALMYDDSRAAEHLEALRVAWGPCAERNAYQVQPTWALPKLAWLLRSGVDVKKARLFHVADFLGTWLAGRPVPVDSSHALKAGYDLVQRCWPLDAFGAAEIPAELLPPVVAPGSRIGAVGAKAAEATGLPEGTPLIAGMTDGCASQIASGAVRPGQWNCALGTTFVLKGVSTQLLRDPSGAVYSHPHPDGGWLPGGASSSGGGALAALFPGCDPSHLDTVAQRYLPTRVIRYPLATRGERFPFVRPDAEPFARGTPGADGERAAAVLQGLAFVVRLSLSYVASLGADTSGSLTLTGGATRSALWNQIHADVLGRPVMLPESPDAAVGMAILAAVGDDALAATARRMVRIARIFEPEQDRSERYLVPYQHMIGELESRGYIDASLADQARAA